MKKTDILIITSYLQHIKKDGQILIWHSLFNNPLVIEDSVYKLLNFFRHPVSVDRALNCLPDQDEQETLNIIKLLLKNRFLNRWDFDERSFFEKCIQKNHKESINGSFIDYLELRVSEACNFSCSYCILKNAERLKDPSYKKIMSFETAKKSIDFYVQLLKKHSRKKAEITFGGAEPTMNWLVIKKSIEYIEETYSKDLKFVFYLNTNFSLLDLAKIDLIKKYKIKVSPSIDGKDSLANDRTRKLKNGQGTFDNIMNVIKELRKSGIKIDGCSTTTNESNFHLVDQSFVDWAKENRFMAINLNIDVMNTTNFQIDSVVDHMIKLIRYARENRMEISGFWRRAAENISHSLENYRVGFCGALRGDNLCVDPEGDIYSCGYSNQKIGTINDFGNFFKEHGFYQDFLIKNSIINISSCKGCLIEGSCTGGCLITREFSNGKNDLRKIQQMCEFYRRMTKKLLYEQF
jgi:uncharacterized protein